MKSKSPERVPGKVLACEGTGRTDWAKLEQMPEPETRGRSGFWFNAVKLRSQKMLRKKICSRSDRNNPEEGLWPESRRRSDWVITGVPVDSRTVALISSKEVTELCWF